MTASDISRVCVIGAGVMGAGIAAQVANAGVPILLLDIVPKSGEDRSALARGAVAKMLKTEPAPFMSPEAARLVETGNIEDDLGRAADCDWIVEAVIERLDLKQALYRRLAEIIRPGTAVSSNTSTIPLASLVGGLPEAFAKSFLVTHFFNPPRYMRLLEVVPGPVTDPELVARVEAFADYKLGKSIVRCKDTPGFIANRIGCYWLQRGMNAAIDLGLSVEEADAVMGRPFGIPKTGVFGLLDLVGLDLMPHIDASMKALLKGDDAYVAGWRDNPLLTKMIGEGYTGRKGKGGFYRINRERGKVKESIGLVTGEYEPSQPLKLPDAAARDMCKLVAAEDKYGRYAWAVMGDVLAYAAALVPEISDDIAGVDAAMRLGFNWKQGPFEILDKLGPAAVAARLERDGRTMPTLLRAVGAGTFYRVGRSRASKFPHAEPSRRTGSNLPHAEPARRAESKHAAASGPSFDTAASRPAQDEGGFDTAESNLTHAEPARRADSSLPHAEPARRAESKHAAANGPSFDTAASRPAQDEGGFDTTESNLPHAEPARRAGSSLPHAEPARRAEWKHAAASGPSFDTAASRPAQDEGGFDTAASRPAQDEGGSAIQMFGPDGTYRPLERAEGVLLLEDVKRRAEPLLKNGSAALWDVGEGVACFEITTKMNSFDPGVLALIEKSIPFVAERFKAMVIYSDATNFSAGANLAEALFACNIAAWGEIGKLVDAGQRAFKALKYAPFPVVGAPAGLALGGGCEILLHCDALQAHAESYMGLVECGVGLVPGWGGCGEMLARWSEKMPRGPMPAATKVFETVSVAKVSKSAAEARAMRILREGDGITFNRDRLLFDARAKALAMVEGYEPPETPEFRLPGSSGRAAFRLAAEGFAKQGLATAHDLVVADGLAAVLTGGDADPVDVLSEADLLALERREFLALIRNGSTLDRIEHMLATGKPLRN